MRRIIFIVFLIFCVIQKILLSQYTVSFNSIHENENTKVVNGNIKIQQNQNDKIEKAKEEVNNIEHLKGITEDELKSIVSKIESLKELLKNKEKNESELNYQINGLENDKADKEKLISSLTEALLDKIKKLSDIYKIDIKDSKFALVGNVSINPTGQTDANKLAPELLAHFKEKFDVNNDSCKWLNWFWGQYEVNFNIKTPVQSKDTNTLLTNVVKAGADGSLDFALKGGWGINQDKFAFIVGVDGKLNWLYSKQFDTNTVNSIGYGTFSALAAIKIFPIVIAFQGDYNFTSNSTSNLLSKALNKSWAYNLYIGLNLDNLQVSMKYLLNSNVAKLPDERLEIKLGVAYDPF